MPRLVQHIAQVLPLTHFVDLIRGIVLRGASIAELEAPFLKLLGFTALIISAVTLRFRKRLD
jgi:ABC-2 type transport system permease protein